jgi:hypothetical protein
MTSPRFIEIRHRRNFRYGTAGGFLLFIGVLTAYQIPQNEVIVQHEEDLSAAGFIVRPAITPELQTMLRLLPAYQVVPRIRGGKIRFVYADPNVCDCLFVGSQQAYDLYKTIRLEQHIAHQRSMTARI